MNDPNVFLLFVRIFVACVCGGAIGFERTRRLKEAGIRTHCIIAAGAALLMILSKYAFTDLADAAGTGTRGADAARIAAQVVSGISFLGAGVIFKNGSSVKGLTTAAGIWATAAVGMAIGAGSYALGIGVTLLIVAVQLIFHRYSFGNDAYGENDIQITVVDSPEFRARFERMVDAKEIQIVTMRMDRQLNGTVVCSAVVRTKKDFTAKDAARLFDSIPGIRTLSL